MRWLSAVLWLDMYPPLLQSQLYILHTCRHIAHMQTRISYHADAHTSSAKKSSTQPRKAFDIPSEPDLCPASMKYALYFTPACSSPSTNCWANFSGHTSSPVPCTTQVGTPFNLWRRPSRSRGSSKVPRKNSRHSKKATDYMQMRTVR